MKIKVSSSWMVLGWYWEGVGKGPWLVRERAVITAISFDERLSDDWLLPIEASFLVRRRLLGHTREWGSHLLVSCCVATRSRNASKLSACIRRARASNNVVDEVRRFETCMQIITWINQFERMDQKRFEWNIQDELFKAYSYVQFTYQYGAQAEILALTAERRSQLRTESLMAVALD